MLSILTENNVNNKYAFIVYLVLISVNYGYILADLLYLANHTSLPYPL